MDNHNYHILIAGTRSFDDYELMKKACDTAFPILSEIGNIVIVSGAASGADRLGERYASEHNYKVLRFPADWNKYGKAAGPIRNAEMAAIADFFILFWDGYSAGSENMLVNAQKHAVPGIIIRYTSVNIKEVIEAIDKRVYSAFRKEMDFRL